ncbi:hypothetical protein Hanom_Chr04g00335921 [Helianthus anomalus]
MGQLPATPLYLQPKPKDPKPTTYQTYLNPLPLPLPLPPHPIIGNRYPWLIVTNVMKHSIKPVNKCICVHSAPRV